MRVRRAVGLSAPHAVISSEVRKQPMQSPLSRWITQIFTQGDSVSSRAQGSSTAQVRQPVQRALQDVTGSYVVNHVSSTRA